MTSIRILLAGALLAVTAQADSAIRIYDVDAAYRQEVVEILSRMLNHPEPRLQGTVVLLPSGQVAVDTLFDQRAAEIEDVLEAIAEAESGATPTVTLRYWMLQGTQGTDDSVSVPDVLDDVIRELETVYGDLGINTLDVAIVSGRAGRQAFYGTDSVEIMQTAYASEDELNANIFFGNDDQELMVEVSLTAGDFVVLNSGTSPAGMVALIVNWPGTD